MSKLECNLGIIYCHFILINLFVLFVGWFVCSFYLPLLFSSILGLWANHLLVCGPPGRIWDLSPGRGHKMNQLLAGHSHKF